MTPQEETKVMQMTRQERMAHFGRLLGSKTITWKQYAYIINLSDTPSGKEDEEAIESKERTGNEAMDSVQGEGAPITPDEFVESLKFQDIITVMTAG